MSTEKKDFDQAGDLMSSVRWLRRVSQRKDFLQAMAWVKRTSRRLGIALNRNDTDEHPERTFRVYRGMFHPAEWNPGYKEGLAAAKKAHRDAARKPTAPLFDAFPWTKPTTPNGDQP
jgi:hypothetical protein